MAVIELHPAPSAGFEEPFEMLEACHERVLRMLALLERLQEHLGRRGADQTARDAARDLMRYFDLAAPAHHQDEERHVLPRLLALGRIELAHDLLQQHERMAALWQSLRRQLLALLAAPPAAQVALDGSEFARLYREHVDLEESLAFPVVRSHMDAQALQQMGQEMSARRGLG